MPQHLFPCLTTERLLLREPRLTDDEAIFALRSNEQVNTYIQRPLASDINDARYFITSINNGIKDENWLYWVMILQSTQQLIGTICLWHFSNDATMAEVGYELHTDFQGAGLMNEALQKIIDYGFTTLQLKAIEAFTQPDNERSVKLLQKNNFIVAPLSQSSASSREIRFILKKATL